MPFNHSQAASVKNQTAFHGYNSSREQSEGAHVVIQRDWTSEHALRIATISWSVSPHGRSGQSPDEFLSTLKDVKQFCGNCDLSIAAGFPVNGDPSPKAILEASHDRPVLFESNSGSWLLTYFHQHEPTMTIVRRQQIVSKYDQYDDFPTLAAAISSGAGVIEFSGFDFKLVLLICGENNVLQFKNRKSVLKPKPNELRRLAPIFSGSWAVVNPAHNPYWRNRSRPGEE